MSKQYLFRMKIFSKKNSHPLETISFFSGQSQYDVMNNKSYPSNTKDNVVWNNIEVPNKDTDIKNFLKLPEYLKFRSVTPKKDMVENARNILWQQVSTRETRDDAQLSRMFEVAIPSFLTTVEAIESVKEFSKVLVSDGLIADCSLHVRKNILSVSLLDRMKTENEVDEEKVDNDKLSNKSTAFYQGFIICPLREYNEGRFENKNREWNKIHKLEEWRYNWVKILATKIKYSGASQDEKDSWEEKMSIYGEYKEIKENLENENNISKKKSLKM